MTEQQQQPSEDDIDRKAALDTGAYWADVEQKWNEWEERQLKGNKLTGCIGTVFTYLLDKAFGDKW